MDTKKAGATGPTIQIGVAKRTLPRVTPPLKREIFFQKAKI
jgi:hypothetical protein